MARPSKYDPTFCDQARKLCKLGATDIEVADFFGVNVATLYRWKNDHPSFCEALKEGKTEADARVVDSLYHRAVGYSYDSEKVFQFQGAIIRAPVREHVPPDTTACIFWLKNRQAADWRDKQEHEHRFGTTSEMSDEELAAIVRRSRERTPPPKGDPPVTH